MRLTRKWIVALLLCAVAGGVTAWSVADLGAFPPQEVPKGDYWHNYDGKWSYWHEADHRWYYTDGSHWYYHNGASWVLYPFDKLFGTIGFLMGGYRPPPPPEVVVPHHDVYHHR
jgi:hypothetical protein